MPPKIIFVIEDDPDIREFLVERIERSGYRTYGYINGEEALHALQDGTTFPDLILLDLLMPVMDGREFRQAQLKDPRFAQIPVIILSGNAKVPEIAASLKVSAWMTKPFVVVDLMTLIESHLAG